jgi:hypothetical protein
MADEYARASLVDVCHHGRKLVDDAPEGPWAGRRFAPAEARSIVRGDTRRGLERVAHDGPANRRGRNRGFQHDRRPSLPADQGVQAASRRVNEGAWRRKSQAIAPKAQLLIDEAERHDCGEHFENEHASSSIALFRSATSGPGSSDGAPAPILHQR